jgi:hypothetical protein
MASRVEIPAAAAPGLITATLDLTPADAAAAIAKLSRAAPAYAEYADHSSPAPAAEPSMGAWDLVWTTDPEDHARDAVTAAAWAPALPGLPGGDGHAGWLITGSCGLVQLWECSPSAGRGEPALAVMHSQSTDLAPAAFALERETRTLLAVAAETRGGGGEVLAAHSLEPETLLAVRGRAALTSAPGSPARRSAAGPAARAVASLHRLGGPLAAHLAARPLGGFAHRRDGGRRRRLWRALGGRPARAGRAAGSARRRRARGGDRRRARLELGDWRGARRGRRRRRARVQAASPLSAAPGAGSPRFLLSS